MYISRKIIQRKISTHYSYDWLGGYYSFVTNIWHMRCTFIIYESVLIRFGNFVKFQFIKPNKFWFWWFCDLRGCKDKDRFKNLES